MKKCILPLLLLFLLLAVGVKAESVLPENERFVCREFEAVNGTLEITENGNLLVKPSNLSAGFRTTVDARSKAIGKDAVRVVLENDSSADSLLMRYEYVGDSGEKLVGETSITIARQKNKIEYLLETDVAERITDVTFLFGGGESGTITVSAIGFAETEKKNEGCGEIRSCVYDRETGETTVSGVIWHEVTVEYRDATLGLYVLDNGKTKPGVFDKPIAKTTMSTHFEFHVPVTDADTRLGGYCVAILDGLGYIRGLTSGTYATVPETGKTDETPLYKGVRTETPIVASLTDADTVLVDVYLDRLTADERGGFLYTSFGTYYHFERSYVKELDELIRQYYENGCKVFLRLCLTPGTDAVFAGKDGMLFAGNNEAGKTLYAYIGFLCDRYSGAEKGEISGFAANGHEGFLLPSSSTARAFADGYADALYVISSAMSDAGMPRKLWVPVSLGNDSLPGTVPNEVFLCELGDSLEKRYLGGFTFEILLESGEAAPLPAIREFSDFIVPLGEVYSFIGRKLSLDWEPGQYGDGFPGRYAEVYRYFADKEKTGCLILSTAGATSEDLWKIIPVLKYTDTDADGDITARVKLLPNPNPESQHIRAMGQYVLFDFSEIGADYGFEAGIGCSDVKMENQKKLERALTAMMTPESAAMGWSELVYFYQDGEAVDLFDEIGVSILIDTPKERKFNVRVELCGKDVISEVSYAVNGSENYTFYLDTTGFTETPLRVIRVFTSPADGKTEDYKLCVGSLTARSASMQSDALRAKVESRRADKAEKEEPIVRMNAFWVYLIILVGIVSVIVVLTLARASDNDGENDIASGDNDKNNG